MLIQLTRRLLRPQPSLVCIFSYQVIHPPRLALPVQILPWAAHRGDILEPRRVARRALQFFAIAKFPGTARTLQTVKLMVTWHGAIATLPIAVERSNVTHKRGDACHGRNQQMLGPAAAQIEREAPLGYFSAEQRVASIQSKKIGRKISMRNQFHEKLECVLIRRGNDGVRSFDPSSLVLDSQRRVLPGTEFERSPGIDSNGPQIGRKIPALKNPGSIVFVRRRSHYHFPRARVIAE